MPSHSIDSTEYDSMNGEPCWWEQGKIRVTHFQYWQSHASVTVYWLVKRNMADSKSAEPILSGQVLYGGGKANTNRPTTSYQELVQAVGANYSNAPNAIPTQIVRWRKEQEVIIKYTCSNCGKHFQTRAMVGVPDGMYYSGSRAVGDAFYCENCVNTWSERNGKPFDEQYKDPKGMFAKWWNREVDRQAKIEGKTVSTYRVIDGEYVKEG